MIYNIHYDVSAMVVSLLSIIFVITKKGMYRRQNKILFSILIVGFFAALFDITSSIGNSYIVEWSYPVRDFHNYAYLLLHNAMPCMVCWYIVNLTGVRFQRGNLKRWMTFFLMPLFLMILLLFSNVFNRQIFFYDADRVYTHGSLFYILFFVAYFYIILCFYLLIRYGKYVSLPRKIMLYLFFILSSISIGLQIVFPKILLQLFVEACCSLGLVITVDNDDESRDSISTCYNRNTFIYNFNIYSHNDFRMNLLLIHLSDVGSLVRSMGVKPVHELKRAFGDYLKTISENLEYYYLENEYYALVYSEGRDIQEIQTKLQNRLQEGWDVNNMHLQCNASIATLKYPEQLQSLEELLTIISVKGSDVSQETESNSTEGSLETLRAENTLEELLRKALKYHELNVFYQPVWSSEKNRIIAGEALVRLNDLANQKIEAETLVRIAEKNGLMKELFEYVLRSVCEFIAGNPLEELKIEYISVNLSKVQFFDTELAQRISSIVDEYAIAHSSISFEINNITENSGYDNLIHILEELHSFGFSIIADGFGGSNISNMDICNFNFDQVKFSRKLLDRLPSNRKINTFLTYCVRMFSGMGIPTCMVGVDNQGDKNLLQNMGVQLIQGYYFSAAIPDNEFCRYVSGFNSM